MEAVQRVGAFELLQDWRHKLGGQPPKPARKDLDVACNQPPSLCHEEEPPGNPAPARTPPLSISNTALDEDEVWAAVKQQRCGRSPGTAGACACLVHCLGPRSFPKHGKSLLLWRRAALRESCCLKSSA